MPDRKRRDPRRTVCAAVMFASVAAAGWFMLPASTDAQTSRRADEPAIAADQPVLWIDDAHILEGDTGVRSLVFTLHLSAPMAESVTVDIATFDGTATVADQDYEPVSYQVTFPPASTAESLAVSVLGDAKLEGDEWFGIRLAHPVGAALADTEGVGTITNDDLPILSIDDASIREGDTGAQNLVFTVHLSAPMAESVTVDIATFDGTATVADQDYEPVSYQVTFPPASTAESLAVSVLGDTKLEGDETFLVHLSHPVGATLADSEAVGTITNDDLPILSIDDASIREGDTGVQNLVFTVHLSAQMAEPVTVDITTSDGTATVADSDYAPVSLQLTFPPASTAESLAVSVLGDTKLEGDETFLVHLSHPVGATLADSEAVGTIANDDLPVLSVDDARTKEGDSGVHDLLFTVRLSAPMADSVTVDVSTFNGTATAADGDYIPVRHPLTFPPAAVVETFAVPVLGDRRLEGNDWIRVRLTHPVEAALADSEAIGTITNDEHAVFVHCWLAETDYTAGTLPSAWGDFNADGYQDLPLFAGGPSHTFTEIPGFRGLLANGNYHGASWCDYDRDGDLDLALLGYDVKGLESNGRFSATDEPPTPNLLLQNQGDGTFVNVAPALGMDIAANGETAAWGDFDGDGWPDLFAPYYSFRYPFQSFFYHNDGSGTFTEQASARGVSLPGLPVQLRPEGVQAADWDNDGDLDLYCASHLFLNDGNGNFTDVREAVGLPVQFDEGASFVDYDNDGDLDLYLRGGSGPRLFRNDNGHFIDVTTAAGITEPTLFWGDSWADVDNDGDLDLVQHCLGRAHLLLNQGDGTFERDPAFESVNTGQELSAWADVDGDGDLDVVMGAMGKELLINQLGALPHFFGSHVRVRVLDEAGHETVHGATVRLRELGGPPGTTQTRVVDGGSGYLGQNEYTVQFGVATTAHYALEVVYPSPAGSRVVVDSMVNNLLGRITAGEVGDLTFTVYRDGRVERTGLPTAGVGTIWGARAGSLSSLGQPSPMPARGSVSLPVQMAKAGRAVLSIHDLGGRLVRRLDPGTLSAGTHTAVWNLADEHGTSVPTGVYFCRMLVNGGPVSVRRLLVVR